MKHGDVQLLITAGGSRICAYDINSGAQVFEVSGRLGAMGKDIIPRGLSTDGAGHILVVDKNNWCVHMLSTNGKYIDTVFKEGQHGLAKPHGIGWCAYTSSLVINHTTDDELVLSSA